ncbi:tetratricopeptide repeat-containing sulfotransferase family protein [Tsuneonella mangrovi]|uniref:tetratricopeptide repeat-containing sulfotransferase family protein n=1 Tax=Tsuneonella mangrovi TaxID=1982042 RepID=UPI001F0A6733|nr:sulfotransferase [Tsuneonella mangrovi]
MTGSPAAAPAGYDPRLMAAAAALNANDLARAEPLLREYLKQDPFDVFAIRMLAELAGRIGRMRDAETLLRRALELAPDFTAARSNLALVLYRTGRPVEAMEELDQVRREEPDEMAYANLRAAALGGVGEFDEALALYQRVLDERPAHPKVWMSYGHMLKTVGRLDDSIAAYRRAIDLRPELGEVWWSLANLKTYSFDDADLAAMEAMLARDDLSQEDRFHFDFALGKAREDRGEADAAFAHYLAGNGLRRELLHYDVSENTARIDRMIAQATPGLFAAHEGDGCDAPDPIFILGMPRAGSTLIEQILSSHSQVEGTSELQDIPELARQLDEYPDRLGDLSAQQLRETGESYLKRTRIYRRTAKPLFIDKLPNNWMHTALIHLALPNAKIIDARRHPLGCCFSNFKQHFARGQSFSYDLSDLGTYYRNYVRLMAHIDAVLPGRVHRVIYEDMVEDTEGEVRRLLDYCGLPFEEACLEFHRTERAVRTASSEQVRQPIYRGATTAFEQFEPYLDPLVAALGPALEGWRTAP